METQRLLLLRNMASTLAKTADLSERRPQQHNSTIKRKNTFNPLQTCANTDSTCSDEERCKLMENRFQADFLLFCLLETRLHATTDANRRAGFFMHLFLICVTSYHFLIPSFFIKSLWHNITLGVCKSWSSTQIMQEFALFSVKNYTVGTHFTQPPVVMIATNLNSEGGMGGGHHKLLIYCSR